MKKLLVVSFFLAVLMACQQKQAENTAPQTPQTVETPIKKEQKFLYEELTAEEKKSFEEKIPTKVREVLETAETIEVFINLPNLVQKKRINLVEGFSPNQVAKISNPALKKQILNAFFQDVRNGKKAGENWNPQYGLRVSSKNMTTAVALCYECGSFRGKSGSASFRGAISEAGSNLSEKVINEIIDKYAQDIEQ